MKYTLPKCERLSSIKDIELLYKSGQSLFVHPIKLLYCPGLTYDPIAPLKVVISVPKRIFKKASTRNLLKRRLREAYRMNKLSLVEALKKKNQSCNIMLIYVGREEMESHNIEKSMIRVLGRLQAIVDSF